MPVVEIVRRRRAEDTESGGTSPSAIRALIIAPTRELARQIGRVAAVLVEAREGGEAITVDVVTGGARTGTDDDARRLASAPPDVLIGTPGRLHDLLGLGGGARRTAHPALRMSSLEILILDEADRILDEGFERHVSSILSTLPKQRRTGLFSATQTEELGQLARAGLRNPYRVVVRQQHSSSGGAAGGGGGGGEGGKAVPAAIPCADVVTPSQIALSYALCAPDEKLAYLERYIISRKSEKGIVYVLTCACVEFLWEVLRRRPLSSTCDVWALHGKMKQKQRTAALAAFAASRGGGVLVCTDVAARGLDIPAVQWVAQMDPPQDPAFFVHRVGRTARMGTHGKALLLLNPNEEPYVRFLASRKVPAMKEAHAEREGGGEGGGGGGANGGASGSCDGAVVRALNLRDRECLEKSVKAFVSYIRAYIEHHAQFIFVLKELDVGRVANAFGLLRLPKMKELKKLKKEKLQAFVPSDIDPNTVPYADAAKEKARLREKRARDGEREGRGGDGRDGRDGRDGGGIGSRERREGRGGGRRRSTCLR